MATKKLTLHEMEHSAPEREVPRARQYDAELTRLQIEVLKMQQWKQQN